MVTKARKLGTVHRQARRIRGKPVVAYGELKYSPCKDESSGPGCFQVNVEAHGHLLPDDRRWPAWVKKMNGRNVYFVIHPSYNSAARSTKRRKR